jgi:hypothetical protein
LWVLKYSSSSSASSFWDFLFSISPLATCCIYLIEKKADPINRGVAQVGQ